MNPITRIVVFAVASVFLCSTALAAECGQISVQATSKNRTRAIAQANQIGQQETDRLDRRYGDAIEYQRARVSCRGSGYRVTCRITQRYCIAEDSGQDDPPYVDGGGVDPNTPQCRRWNAQCDDGRRSACLSYENNCQND
jgi:hypothetical protein